MGAASPEYHPESLAMHDYWQVEKSYLPPELAPQPVAARSIQLLMSSTRHAVMRSPSVRTGCG